MSVVGFEASESIKFGSHGDESTKSEVNEVSVSNFPKDTVAEWPTANEATQGLHKEVENMNKARFQISEALRGKRTDRAELIGKIKALREDNMQIRTIVDGKFKDLQPLQQALGQLRIAESASRTGVLCSSEEELNGRIHGLWSIMEHESLPLREEKRMLREIRQLESTRGQVIANAALLAELAPKEILQNKVKLTVGDLDGVKKEQLAVRSKIKQLEDALEAIDKEISSLEGELKDEHL